VVVPGAFPSRKWRTCRHFTVTAPVRSVP